MNASRLFAAIMNGQSRAIGNIGYTRQDEDKPSQAKKTKKQKNKKQKQKPHVSKQRRPTARTPPKPG
jgi:hypothetical protein